MKVCSVAIHLLIAARERELRYFDNRLVAGLECVVILLLTLKLQLGCAVLSMVWMSTLANQFGLMLQLWLMLLVFFKHHKIKKTDASRKDQNIS